MGERALDSLAGDAAENTSFPGKIPLTGKRVAEHGHRFGKTNAVFVEVRGCSVGIPFEFHQLGLFSIAVNLFTPEYCLGHRLLLYPHSGIADGAEKAAPDFLRRDRNQRLD